VLATVGSLDAEFYAARMGRSFTDGYNVHSTTIKGRLLRPFIVYLL
jgi:hypothetical protein